MVHAKELEYAAARLRWESRSGSCQCEEIERGSRLHASDYGDCPSQTHGLCRRPPPGSMRTRYRGTMLPLAQSIRGAKNCELCKNHVDRLYPGVIEQLAAHRTQYEQGDGATF